MDRATDENLKELARIVSEALTLLAPTLPDQRQRMKVEGLAREAKGVSEAKE